MPINLPGNHASLIIRRSSFERAGLTRSVIDDRLGLTDEEFRVEGTLIVIGPVLDDDGLLELIAEMEEAGLSYYDDFFDLSGNWPDWVRLFVGEA